MPRKHTVEEKIRITPLFFSWVLDTVHLFTDVVSLDLTGWKRQEKSWKLDILLIKFEARGLIALNSRYVVEPGFDYVVIFSLLRSNADLLSPQTSRHTCRGVFVHNVLRFPSSQARLGINYQKAVFS